MVRVSAISLLDSLSRTKFAISSSRLLSGNRDAISRVAGVVAPQTVTSWVARVAAVSFDPRKFWLFKKLARVPLHLRHRLERPSPQGQQTPSGHPHRAQLELWPTAPPVGRAGLRRRRHAAAPSTTCRRCQRRGPTLCRARIGRCGWTQPRVAGVGDLLQVQPGGGGGVEIHPRTASSNSPA